MLHAFTVCTIYTYIQTSACINNLTLAIFFHIDMSNTSAEAVVLTAFGAHFLKEVSRSQLESAAKSLLATNVLTNLKKADKGDFIIPLAEALIKHKIVKVVEDADWKQLGRQDLEKVGTF